MKPKAFKVERYAAREVSADAFRRKVFAVRLGHGAQAEEATDRTRHIIPSRGAFPWASHATSRRRSSSQTRRIRAEEGGEQMKALCVVCGTYATVYAEPDGTIVCWGDFVERWGAYPTAISSGRGQHRANLGALPNGPLARGPKELGDMVHGEEPRMDSRQRTAGASADSLRGLHHPPRNHV